MKLLLTGLLFWVLVFLMAYLGAAVGRHAASSERGMRRVELIVLPPSTMGVAQYAGCGLCCGTVGCDPTGGVAVLDGQVIRGGLSRPVDAGRPSTAVAVAPALLEEFGLRGAGRR